MISSIITPFRWYNKYYQQNRFDIECKSVCEFQLITDQRHLLPFQFKRSQSIALPTDFILRKCCVDSESPILTGTQSNFVEGWNNSNGAWSLNLECGCGIKANTESGYANSNICFRPPLIIGEKYTIYFNVEAFSTSGSMVGHFISGSTTLTITTAVEYQITFVADDDTICFNFEDNEIGDVINICNVQITPIGLSLIDEDVILNPALLHIKNLGDFDMISYCGDDLGFKIPVGCYYAIIKDTDNNLYYSEVITVKNFPQFRSPYFLLEWYNSCDLKDVVYSGANGCEYKNKLYLPDAVLTRPQYPFKEEGDEDGNQNFNPTFQKWEKIVSLIAYKLPEFIVDSLTAIKLHNNVQYYYPLRQKQNTIDAPVIIKRVEYNAEPVLDDCFTNVELKLTLDEQFTDETCCTNLSSACKTCSKTIPGINIFDEENYQYALIPDDGNIYLWQYINVNWAIVGFYEDGVWTSTVSSVGDIFCDDSIGPLNGGGGWQIQDSEIVYCPNLTSFVPTTGLNWLFIGDIFLNTYGQIEYSNNAGVTWLPLLPKFSQAELKSGIEITTVDCCCTLIFRIKCFDLNGCAYGTKGPYEGECPTSDCC